MGRVSSRILYVGALLLLMTSRAPSQAGGQAPTRTQTAQVAGLDQHRAMLSTYCSTCHSSRVKSGGITLEGLDLLAEEPALGPLEE